jgi:hypothetical protein
MSQNPQPYDLNYLIVMMTQAMIGLVSSTLLGVAIEADDSRIRVYFAVRKTSPEQGADIEEIVSDFEAFLYPNVPEIEVQVSEGYPTGEWIGAKARQVFRMKE